KPTGKLYWRPKGEKKFTEVPLVSSGPNRFDVKLSAAVTKGPFEYYLEIQDGKKGAKLPAKGDQAPFLATPDVTPPTAVSDLAATLAKSYRVALGWKAATDDVR